MDEKKLDEINNISTKVSGILHNMFMESKTDLSGKDVMKIMARINGCVIPFLVSPEEERSYHENALIACGIMDEICKDVKNHIPEIMKEYHKTILEREE